MPYVFCYEKKGTGCYPDDNYPGRVAENCDWEHAMHLAVSLDSRNWTALRNNTGILFAKASFEEDPFVGVTKTMVDPWIFRTEEGKFGVCSIRRNRHAADSLNPGSVMIQFSDDLVFFTDPVFLTVGAEEVRNPRCMYRKALEVYELEWETSSGIFGGITHDLKTISEIHPLSGHQLVNGKEIPLSFPDGKNCIWGNQLEIGEQEYARLCSLLGEIRMTGVEPIDIQISCGDSVAFADLPAARCQYSDGSVHEKNVLWNEEEWTALDFSKPGVYEISGEIQQKRWTFPMPLAAAVHEEGDIGIMSDPCVTAYRGKFFLTSTGTHRIQLRTAESIEGTFGAEPVVLYEVPLTQEITSYGTWAAELHEIEGALYLFTALCPNGDWTRVNSYVLKCHGDPANPASWEAPRLCVKPDGTKIRTDGISLDMTYFKDHDKNYVMWSDRRLKYGTDPLQAGTADLFIAEIDPQNPWQLITEPQCILRPIYGWDRYETEVDEGPYLLRHGEDLFITVSGSSTAMGDLYDLGLLRAKTGSDLLKAENWYWFPFPFLTKESVPGEFGPGHNNFVKDPDTGDDLMIYHAIPHDKNGKALQRHPGIRRVHWTRNGLPYLEMTADRDLPEQMKKISMKIRIQDKE